MNIFYSNNSFQEFTDHKSQGNWMIITFIARFGNWNNGRCPPKIWYNPMRIRKISSNTGTSSVAQLVSNEDGTQSGPAIELGESLCMASIIMIFSFNLIHVKNIFC